MHYKELIVWQKSTELVNEVYAITKQFPKSEVYALASQMQRSAVAIPSNIAEGHARNHTGEYVQYLGIAYASSAELDTQIIIAKSQYSLLSYQKAEHLLVEVQKMLAVLMKKLKAPASLLPLNSNL